MQSLEDLAREMEKLDAHIKEDASKIAANVAVTIAGDLAFKTPVDTSQALSNWVTSLDMPTEHPIPPHFPGEQGSTYTASATETLNRARLTVRDKKPGQPIFITNNVHYIKELNDGSSRQQPAGFVERAVLLGRKMTRDIKWPK